MTLQVAKKIVQQRTDALLPYARNSRTHSEEQVYQIAQSIREFGFTNPVLVDADNNIVAGHGRVMAAKQLVLQYVPTINVGWMTEQQRRAYVIADNQLALNAGWDDSGPGSSHASGQTRCSRRRWPGCRTKTSTPACSGLTPTSLTACWPMVTILAENLMAKQTKTLYRPRKSCLSLFGVTCGCLVTIDLFAAIAEMPMTLRH